MENLDKLVNELRKLPTETQWLEFKHNNYTPDMIGKDISALANSASLYEKSCAYMLWGIDDETHEIVGTDYDLQTLKKGNQELENWLRSLLSKNADFEFHTVQMAEEKRVGVLIIYKATNQTVMFDKVDYIRVGSYTKRLSEYPAMQAQLWDKIRNSRFEERYAKQDLRLEDALRMLDYSVYFDNCGIIQPTDFAGVAHYMQQDEIVVRQDNGLYAITNLGAILFAKHLSEFPRLSRKAVRIVQYEGNNRLSMLKENIGNKGYAVGFEGLMKFVEALIPTQEPIVGALRENRSAYPILAIREAVANALIHQDFSISGTGPVIEIFEKRTIFAKTRLSWLSPFSTLLILSVVSVFCNVRTIISRFSCGRFFSSRKALILRRIISPSRFPVSIEDFNSDFSRAATLPGTPSVAMMDAATRYTRSRSLKPFSF